MRGGIIKQIKALSGASQVHIQEEQGAPSTPVQVLGPPESVLKVGELVQAVLNDRHDAIGFVRIQLDVPDKMRQSLSGPIGFVLKRISSASGAWVQQPQGQYGPLIITGLPDCVESAKQMVAQGDAPDPNFGETWGGGCPGCGGGKGSGGGGKGGCGGPQFAQGPADGGGNMQMQMQLLAAHMQGAGGPGGGCGAPQGIPAAFSQAGAAAAQFQQAGGGGFGGKGYGGYGGPPGGAGGPRAPGSAAEYVSRVAGGITQEVFEIPANKVKDVLGVKGRNIKAIKQQSNIQKIAIMDRSEPATVTVTGTQQAIETAKYMVLAVAAGDQTVIGNLVEVMEIDQKMVSKLIGPKGQVISQIKDQSGCYLEVRETETGNRPRIIMTGPRQSIDTAKELISNFLGSDGGLAALGQVMPGMPGAGEAPDPYALYAAQALLAQQQLQAQAEAAAAAGAGGQMTEAQIQEAQLQALANAQIQAQMAAGAGGDAGGASAADLSQLYQALAAQMQQQQGGM